MRIKTLFLSIVLITVVACEKIEKMDLLALQQVVVSESQEHLAFPSIEKLSSGELVCVFRRGRGHVSPDGNILLSRSNTNGYSWTPPDTIISTRLDCRDPSIMELSDGTLLLNFFQSKYDTSGKIIGPFGVFVSRSYDGGQTWYTPKMVILEDYDWVATSSRIIETKDGALLLPVYGAREGQKSAALVVVSRDFGRTWNETHVIAFDSTGVIAFQEPALVQLPDGRILCVMRTAGDGHFQYQSYSGDGGKTWSRFRRMNVQGQAAGLLMTKDNILVCAYRDYSPRGTSYSVSYDLGLTYEKETVLHTHLIDQGYAEMVELDPGKVICVYYAAEKGHSRIYASFFRVTRPETPGALHASVTSDSTISLRWNAVKEAHYYRIHRKTIVDSSDQDISDMGKLIAMTTKNVYVDRKVKPSTSYRYQISAVVSSSDLIDKSGAVSVPAVVGIRF